MYKNTVLALSSLNLAAMQHEAISPNKDIIIEIADTSARPLSPTLSHHSDDQETPLYIDDEEIKHWIRTYIAERDSTTDITLKLLQEKIDTLSVKLESHSKKIETHKNSSISAQTKTRAATIATAVTTICGVIGTLVTYFTTRNMHYDSN